MFDAHYDLLSIAYVCYLKNDYSYLEERIKSYRNDNVQGVIANLYFMSEEEMKEELHPKYYQKEVSVVEMFRISTEIIKSYLPNTDLIFSIEGCDFLETSDLDELYSLGLRNILPVWNNKNKYASGNRSNQGLTEEGKCLLEKAIELGISIDLSHANKKSFDDITSYLIEKKELGEDFFVMASHSNARSKCTRERNLEDDQLLAIKELNGLVGVFSNRNFIVPESLKEKVNQQEKEQYYLEHINHIVDLIGIDHVVLATDDMDFCKEADAEYGEVQIYSYDNIAKNVQSTLEQRYSIEDTYQIMYGNMKQRYDMINNKVRKGDKVL